MIRFTVSVNNAQSVPRLLVEQELTKRGTTLADYIDGGRKQGKTIEEIHADLTKTTGVTFSARTLFRWVNQLEVTS